MEYAVKTDSLTKIYRKAAAVSDLDLAAPTGSIYGFLGPNGAGKSTTMKMLLGLVKPSRGRIFVLGKNVNHKNRLEILRDTGSLIESPAYYGHLSGRENLQLIASLKQAPAAQIHEVLRIVRLEGQEDKKAGQYSLGMKQRLGLACALLGSPRLLLLDEPTNGLDPAGIQEMRELIRTLPARFGITVLVSSHLLSEIDQMATHVGIINNGALIFQDRLSVLHEHSRSRMRLRTDQDEAACRILLQAGLPSICKNGVLYLNSGANDTVLRAVRLLVQAGIGLYRLEEEQKSLEEIFLSLVGRNSI